MRQWLRSAGFLAILLAAVATTHAQATPPPDTTLTICQSYFAIDDGWHMKAGDDPAWAAADFDDSAWPLVPSPVQTTAVAWYRTRVRIQPNHPPLALMLDAISSRDVLYVNGRRGGQSLWRSGFSVNSTIIPLTETETNNTLLLALRVEINPARGADDAIDKGTVTLGSTEALGRMQKASRSAMLISHIPQLADNTLEFVLAFALLAYCLLTRRSTDYLWFVAFLIVDATGSVVSVWRSVVGIEHFPVALKFVDSLGYLGRYIPLTEFLFRFAGRPTPRWARLYQLLLVFSAILLTTHGDYFLSHGGLQLSFLPFDIFAPWLLYRWWRGGNYEALLLLLPISLANAGQLFDSILIFSGFDYTGFSVRALRIYMDDVVVFLFLIAIIPVLLNRTRNVERDHSRTVGELEAARRVQELLIPPKPPATPGFAVETVYLPANEVGGDFFHLSPAADGSLLLIAGDVSGKGLRAAMEVSAVMGALRNEPSRSPAVVLAHLNAMLCGHIEGFVTCCAALLEPNGTTRLANAGNPAPYRDGKEVNVNPSLPLGITLDATFNESTTTLAINQRLVFCSDGVIEAKKPDTHELFGFERTAAISKQPAHEIADMAKRFGQEDDISVVSIQRLI
jgi:sigma-B regulation protein RsbU (phosphoserine phosphatase)